MTLHTSSGCSHDPTGAQTGTTLQESCDVSFPPSCEGRTLTLSSLVRRALAVTTTAAASTGKAPTPTVPALRAREEESLRLSGLPQGASFRAEPRTPNDADEDRGGSISIWHWTRASLPGDVKNGNPDPSTWGSPAATWKSSTCDMSARFRDLALVLYALRLLF